MRFRNKRFCIVLVSQECDEYVLNDNVAGDIKILRSCLQAMSLQNSALSRDDDVSHRRSKRIRRSASVAALSPDL